jgi:hypothetical protein
MMSARRSALALTALVFAGLPIGGHAGPPIYRCEGADGRVLYTDVPCANGHVVDMRPGDADPAAIERLARARQAASEEFSRRVALEAAERRANERRVIELPPPPPDPGTYCEYCGGVYAYPWVTPPPRPPRERPPLRRPPSFVPAR